MYNVTTVDNQLNSKFKSPLIRRLRYYQLDKHRQRAKKDRGRAGRPRRQSRERTQNAFPTHMTTSMTMQIDDNNLLVIFLLSSLLLLLILLFDSINLTSLVSLDLVLDSLTSLFTRQFTRSVFSRFRLPFGNVLLASFETGVFTDLLVGCSVEFFNVG